MVSLRLDPRQFKVLIVGLLLSPALVLGQNSAKPADATSNPPAAMRTSRLRTPWGDPDLQGMWIDTADALTPIERPEAMDTRTTLTDEEFAKRKADLKARLVSKENEIYFEPFKGEPSRRTSMVTDPPNGRIPPYTPEGKQRVDTRAADRNRRGQEPETARDFSLWPRCISRTLPGAWVPMSYNNNRQIFQTKDYVAIFYEEVHDVRIIPLDGRPHVGPNIRSWMGDSRGHWEGDTLVVDVTNFRELVNFKGNPLEVEDIPVTDKAHIVERYARVDAENINYSATIDDPGTYTKPWTLTLPMALDTSQTQILEYACHEGNFNTITTALSGARAVEAKKAVGAGTTK